MADRNHVEFFHSAIRYCELELETVKRTSLNELRETALSNVLQAYAIIQAHFPTAALTQEERSLVSRRIDELAAALYPYVVRGKLNA